MTRKKQAKRSSVQQSATAQALASGGVSSAPGQPSDAQRMVEHFRALRLGGPQAEGQAVSKDRGHTLIFCQGCMKPEPAGVKFPTCSRCRNMHYCSPECQRAHWPVHKHSCDQQTARRKAPQSPQQILEEEANRWRKNHHDMLSHLVHSVLGPRRLRTHYLLLLARYHSTASKPYFEVTEVEAARLGDGDEDIREHMQKADQVERQFYRQNGYKTRFGYAFMTFVDDSGKGVHMISPFGVHGEVGDPVVRNDPSFYLTMLNTASQP